MAVFVTGDRQNVLRAQEMLKDFMSDKDDIGPLSTIPGSDISLRTKGHKSVDVSAVEIWYNRD